MSENMTSWQPVDNDENIPRNKRLLVQMANDYVVIATRFVALAKDQYYLWRNDCGAIIYDKDVTGWMLLPE